MAYKFQLGAAILSGSLTQEGQVLAKDSKISGSSIAITDVSGIAESGGGIVDSGDGTLELEMVSAGATVAVADDTFYFADSDNGDNIRSGSFVDLATGMAGNGISATNGVLAADLNGSSLLNGASGLSVNVVSLAGAGLVENSGVFDVGAGNGITVAADAVTINLSGSDSGLNLDGNGLAVALSSSGGLGNDANGIFITLDDPNSGLTIGANGIKIETGGVTNDMLSGSIANAKLANQSVTVGTTAINLGASSTTLAGMTGIDFAASDASIAASIGANTLTLGGASTTVRVAGDLDVVGTLNRVTETELLIEDKVVIVASGSGTGALASDSGIKVDIATGDMAFLYRNNGFGDAASSGDIWVASGSAGLIDIQAENFYGDGSNLTGVSADTILYSVASKADGNTLEENKVNYFADLSADATVTMPAVTDDDIGAQLFVKAKNLTSDATIIINTANAAQKIDAQDSIVLESPYAAVTLIYVATDDWRVF